MLRSRLLSAVAVSLSIVAPLAATGDDSSWKLPNLNPFASGGKTASRPSTQSGNGWHVPKLWQTTKGPVRPKPRPQASTWSKMTTGTQQMLSKTADTLTPWDNKKPAPPQRVTGSNTAFTHNKPKDKAKDSEFGGVLPASWWSSDKD